MRRCDDQAEEDCLTTALVKACSFALTHTVLCVAPGAAVFAFTPFEATKIRMADEFCYGENNINFFTFIGGPLNL